MLKKKHFVTLQLLSAANTPSRKMKLLCGVNNDCFNVGLMLNLLLKVKRWRTTSLEKKNQLPWCNWLKLDSSIFHQTLIGIHTCAGTLKHCCCDKLVIFFSMSRWLRASMKSVPFQGRFPSGEVSGLPPHASTKTSRTWEFEALQFIMQIQTTVNCHKLDKGWCQVNGRNQFVSSLHMPRRKHQEHGSLECFCAPTMQMFVVPWKPARGDIKIAMQFWHIPGQLSMDACKRCLEVLCYIKTEHDYERTKNFRVVRSWWCSVFVVWTWFSGASANVRCVCSLSSPGLYWEGAVWQLAEKGGQESTGRNVESEEKKFP